MGGEGSMLAMIISLKNNRALLRSKRRRRSDMEARHHGDVPLVYENKMTPGEFEAFKTTLRKERMLRDAGRISLLVLALAAAGAVIYLIIRAAMSL